MLKVLTEENAEEGWSWKTMLVKSCANWHFSSCFSSNSEQDLGPFVKSHGEVESSIYSVMLCIRMRVIAFVLKGLLRSKMAPLWIIAFVCVLFKFHSR